MLLLEIDFYYKYFHLINFLYTRENTFNKQRTS